MMFLNMLVLLLGFVLIISGVFSFIFGGITDIWGVMVAILMIMAGYSILHFELFAF